MFNRRTLAMAAIATLAAPATLVAPALAQGGRSPVRVDLSALRQRGVGSRALAVIEQAMQRELGAYLARSGGGMVVRIDSVSLSPFTGGDGLASSGRLSGGGGVSDYMAGEIIRTDSAGRVITRFPMHNALPSSSGGAWYDPEVDLRRIDALATHFARWAARQAG